MTEDWGAPPLRRYWIEFSLDPADHNMPVYLRHGCGVTATGREDALEIVRASIFGGEDLPPITVLIEDVDIATLDGDHVLPNIGLPLLRGVWFPVGFR